MDKREIEIKLQGALAQLIKDDEFLLVNEVNERSLTHVLAIYLAKEFPKYHVDCEYNRMFKDGEQVPKGAVRLSGRVPIDDLNARTAFPDIIVHRREDDLHNLLVIEAKKLAPQSNFSEDFMKLNGFMETKHANGLGYIFSAFVEFNTGAPKESKAMVKEWGELWPE